ncbi:hypothetical protein SCLCIDRAFT_10358 [Scleroderma citrinum Foug A]|uniref:Uncharacterized protein n=1 Tax=Scleroderma citrinum Foug A TaxID=1036808 RepID=A0A0C2Z792_9AGAM|nr:hypothetical protein SCLCIDRAFT_10358 [Scleroderma citrinum Foug A]
MSSRHFQQRSEYQARGPQLKHGFEIPTLFNVKATPIAGIKDLQLQTENLLKEMDNEIFHKNILLYHLVDRIEMVEHLSESPQKLVEQWEQCTGGTDGHKTN